MAVHRPAVTIRISPAPVRITPGPVRIAPVRAAVIDDHHRSPFLPKYQAIDVDHRVAIAEATQFVHFDVAYVAGQRDLTGSV